MSLTNIDGVQIEVFEETSSEHGRETYYRITYDTTRVAGIAISCCFLYPSELDRWLQQNAVENSRAV
jgi:hypothetical protein